LANEKKSVKNMTEIDVRYLFTCFLLDVFSAFFVNFGFGLLATPTVPLFGTAVGRNFFSPENLIMDCFWISLYSGFFIVLFVTFGVREDFKKGKVKPPSWNRISIPILRHLPKYMLIRGLVFSAICVLIFFPIGVLTLLLLQIESLPYWNFIIIKSLFGVIVSIPTAFVVRICALGDGPKIRKQA
jgi:hypothetical protein